jgi:3-oxoacyl-[acyl-carrier-protein] synthase III
LNSVLKIIAQGAWNGGKVVDNSIYENIGMFFKGGVPVNNETIEKRVGIRTRKAAPPDERIGVTALQDLLDTGDIDPKRIKLVIGATNVGDDMYDPGPLIKYPFELIGRDCPNAFVFDLYAGCPGFNVSVELIFMLSLTGVLKEGDISVIVGAENIHRSDVFEPLDTSNIIFGDDSLATALRTTISKTQPKGDMKSQKISCALKKDFVPDLAKKIFELRGKQRLDGLIIDNQLGKIYYRIPATAARVQHSLIELMYPEETAQGTFKLFKEALSFYDNNINSFAFDIMSLSQDLGLVENIAKAYIESGRYRSIASVYIDPDLHSEITIYEGEGYQFERPRDGIIDTQTSTHGCFGDFIQGTLTEDDKIFAEIDGKGVFLHATRGARAHLMKFLSRNNLALRDIDLLIEHQANFAMIPLTLEQLFQKHEKDPKKAVVDYIANKMVTNIHERGNCSVVCMQRLPYDLQRGALKEDTIQGFPVNMNMSKLKNAKTILFDSVGAGMTRSSVLQRGQICC